MTMRTKKPRTCKNCGAKLKGDRRKLTCGAGCRKEHANRRMLRGAKLLDAAMYWRGKREQQGFSIMCQILDDFLHEDRQAGPYRTNYPRPAVIPGKQVGVALGDKRMPPQPPYVIQL